MKFYYKYNQRNNLKSQFIIRFIQRIKILKTFEK